MFKMFSLDGCLRVYFSNCNFKSICDYIKEICDYKLRYEEVKKDLLESKGKLLIHPALRCRTPEKCIWEGRYVDGAVIGQNLLGKIWMELRENL
jgi:hypothetical protein